MAGKKTGPGGSQLRGKKMRPLFTVWMLGATFVLAAAAQASPEWKLVWSDEFDKDGTPDPAKWTYEKGFVRNQELQWYQPKNARCEKGLLIIEGRRERKKNPDYKPESLFWKTNREYAEYTSSSLTTKGMASLAVWAVRNARQNRHAAWFMAGFLVGGLGGTLAGQR